MDDANHLAGNRDTTIFLHPDRRLIQRHGIVLHREDQLQSILKSLFLMSTGFHDNLIVTGTPGCGKSYMLDVASRNDILSKRSMIAKVGSIKGIARKTFYSTLFSEIFPGKNRETITSTRNAIKNMSNHQPVIILVDDVDNINPRFESEFFSLPSDLGVMIACTSSTFIPKAARWKWVHLDPYTSQQIRDILTSLVEGNIKNSVMPDRVVIDILSSHVVSSFNSSISAAIEILEHAVTIAEDRMIFKGEEPIVVIADVMQSIDDHVRNEMMERVMPISRNFSSSIVFAATCLRPGSTITTIHSIVEKMVEKSFPENKRLAPSTIGNILRSLKETGFIKTTKNRFTKNGGVITSWYPVSSRKHLIKDFLSTCGNAALKGVFK